MNTVFARFLIGGALLASVASAAHAQDNAPARDHFTLAVNGFVQSRYTWLKPELHDASQNFDVALARLAVAGSAFDPKVSYLFQLEASTFGDNNRLTLLDGWMQYRFSPEAAVKAGRVLVPYSRQFLTHPGNLLFTDLSAADYAFNLPRAIGVHVSGSRGRFGYDAAVANSVRALDAAGQQNHGDNLAVVGRAELALLGAYGYLESATDAHPRQLSIGFAAAHNPVADGSTFQNVRPGDRTTGFTVDAGYREGRLTVQAAGYRRGNETPARDLTDRGGYVQAGVYVVPAAWELAARASVVDFAAPNAAETLGDTREYELGINRYLHGHNVKVQGDAGVVRHSLFTGERRDDRRVRVQFQLLF
jgi:phosphate-selective porin OprO and OprP